MARIWIDGDSHEVDEAKNCLETSLALGKNLPYFCWHPALGSVGACRQCAVKQFKDENDRDGKLVMACMTPAKDGTRIAIDDPDARRFRAAVIEWLMLNHPHDCPVCDEGGECHLQDMTVMTGHRYRRFRFRKRTYRSQYLGPLLRHEMNRCIQCYRCVRFYDYYAGGEDLRAFSSHDFVYFGRHEDGALNSPFAGNLVEVCPTGVFTDKTLARHYTRKWDLQTAPSICVHCGLGCNTIPGERYGRLRRIRNRYNGEVNGYFLCDRGRYGYEFVDSERRIRAALAPHGANAASSRLSTGEALRRAADMVARPRRVIGIGSPRASLESNFALRALVGPASFFQGVSAAEHGVTQTILKALRRGVSRTPSLRDVERCDAVFVVGEDVHSTAPRLGLALRQSLRRQPTQEASRLHIPRWDDAVLREAIQTERGPLFVATPHATVLDREATWVYRAVPERIAALAAAVAHALDPAAPAAPALDRERLERAEIIAHTLRQAARPLVVAGAGTGDAGIVEAAANVAWAARAARDGKPAELVFTVPECNTLGLALLGGGSFDEAVALARRQEVDTVIVLENDLYRRAPAAVVDRFLAAVQRVIVIDHMAHDTGARADLLLPAATFAEAHGTLVNNEGRAQRMYRVVPPEEPVRESWRWLRGIAVEAGYPAPSQWRRIDDVIAALAAEVPALAGVRDASPPSDYRILGAKIPRQPHRYSGRTALHADRGVHEPPPPDDPDSPLAFSMEGSPAHPPPPLIARFWDPGWNSVQSLNRFQAEIAGPLCGGDPGVRLIEIEAGADSTPLYFAAPAEAEQRPGWLRVVPLHFVFGSEELSAVAPGIAVLTPGPHVALGKGDAAAIGVGAGARVRVELHDRIEVLPVVVRDDLPARAAGLPVGLPAMPAPLPAWTRITRR